MKSGELPYLLPVTALGVLAEAELESLPWWCKEVRDSWLTSSATTEAQI